MRILNLCFSESLGGNELYVERIGRALEQRGHELAYALKKNSLLAQRIKGRVEVFTPRVPYADLYAGLKLAMLAGRFNAEVLHVHCTRDLPYAAFAKTFHPRLRVIYTKQMLPGGPRMDPFHRWVYGKIDLLLACTGQVRIQLADRVPMPAARIKLLYLGTGLPDLSAKSFHRSRMRALFGRNEADFIILFPNRLDPQKGQMLLVQALARLKSKGLTPYVLFTGKENEDCPGYSAKLQDAIDAQGLSSQCTLTGFIDDLGPLYAAADLVILATREETFGMVLIESMAWGTPVIGSAAGGVPEIIENGKNGFMFSTMDAGSLAGVIEQCMRESDRLPELGYNARKTVELKFSLESHLQALEGYFQATITSSK